jgi:hypothetical protein
MTRPRKALISLADTPYYHVTSRCVRRAFLCGVDHYSGQNYEHRRQWVVDRIRLLSSLFAIDVCAYAVMSNHYHLVLKVCPGQLDDLTEDEILDRWCALFKGPLLIQNYRNGEDLKPFERAAVSDIVNVWRARLSRLTQTNLSNGAEAYDFSTLNTRPERWCNLISFLHNAGIGHKLLGYTKMNRIFFTIVLMCVMAGVSAQSSDDPPKDYNDESDASKDYNEASDAPGISKDYNEETDAPKDYDEDAAKPVDL